MKNFLTNLKKFRHKETVFLALVLLLALGLRSFQLTSIPQGFFCDEASIGYNAYTIWTQGKDEYGNPWPVFFRSFGDYKNPIFIYSMAPVVGLLGLSEWSVRITAVAYGLLTIVAIYLLTKEMFGTKIGLLTALLLAISPWHILMSRVGFETISSAFWTTISFYLLIRATSSLKFYPLALTSFIITFLSYTTPKLYLFPLFLGFLIVYFSKTKLWFKNKYFWVFSLASAIFLFLLISPNFQDGTFFARWDQVRLQSFTLDSLIKSYLNHFSLNFLFKTGDIDFPGQFITRHSIRGLGELYWFQLPAILFFVFSFFFHKGSPLEKSSKVFLVLWLLLYPLGSIFSTINPQATRSFIGVIPFQIVTAVGIIEGSRVLKKFHFSFLNLVWVILIVFSTARFYGLLEKYPNYSADFWGWQYGPKEIVKTFVEEKNNYDELIMTGSFNAPYIFLKFYSPSDCQKCKIGDSRNANLRRRQLFALRPEEIPFTKGEIIIKKEIFYPNQKLAFVIFEIKK